MIKKQKEEEIKQIDPIVQLVLGEKDSYFRQTQEMREDWKSAWASYNNYLEPRKNPWNSDLFIPKTHQAVELLASFLAAKDPTVRARPQSLDDVDKVPKVQKLLSFQWKSILNMRPKILSFAKQAILFGTGIIKLCWRTETIKVLEKQRKIKPILKPPFFKLEVTEKEIEKIVYDDPEVEVCDIADVYIDPFAPTPEDSHSIIHRVLVDLTTAQKNPNYKNANQLIAVSRKYSNDDSSEFDTYDTTQASSTVDKCEIFERWTKERVITIGRSEDGYVLLRDMINPYGMIPFVAVRLKNSPLPNRFYGVGCIVPNLKIQDKMNSLANQIIDNIELLMNSMYKRKRSANVLPRQLISRPGGFIDVDEMDDVEQLQVSDIKASAFSLYQTLDSEFQQGSGVSNLMKGMSGAEFATEVAIQQRNIGTLLGIFQANLEDAIAEIGQKILQLDLQNIQDSRSIVIFKEMPKGVTPDGQPVELEPYEQETINPEEINGIFDIEVVADSTLSQDTVTLRKQLIDVYNLTLNDPNSGVNRPELLKRIFSLTGIPEIDKLFQNPSPAANPQLTPGAENSARVTPAGEGLGGTEAQMKSSMSQNYPNNKI